MLTKLIRGILPFILLFSFSSNATVISFDDCPPPTPDSQVTPELGDGTVAKGCDFVGEYLSYNLTDGNLMVTSSGDAVIQDRNPNDGGLGDYSDGFDNSIVGEWLDFTFEFAIQLKQIHLNGSTGDGHGDGWNDNGDDKEIRLYLIRDDEVLDFADIDVTNENGFLMFANLFLEADDIIRVKALTASGNHYVEAIEYEASGFGINCIPSFPGSTECPKEVPEPNVIFLLSFTIFGIAIVRKKLFS